MPNLAVIQLMRVIIWPRSDSDSSYVKINVRGNKGFYSSMFIDFTDAVHNHSKYGVQII